MHGGVSKTALTTPDPAAVERGLGNLAKHVENIRIFGESPVVALNRFGSDSAEEIAVVQRACDDLGVPFALSEVFARGGDGGVELARSVIDHAERRAQPFRPIYDWSEPVKTKMDKVARAMYGASDAVWTRDAERALKQAEALGLGTLPLCIAKTQKSLSDDPQVVGRPEDFEITVRDLLIAAGAGYLVPLLGDIMRMPGLPLSPQAERMDLVDGRPVGVSAPVA
jgi:formate--tetrahydrofolate ligase